MERSTWELLKANGALTCPVEQACDDPIFQRAYTWMKASMAQAGLPAPAVDVSPWWCWVRKEEHHPGPYIEDLHGLDDPIVLQLSIPAERVVLSCFDLWHFVINRCYVWDSEADEMEFDQAWAAAQNDKAALTALEERMQTSWSAIFELDQDRVDMGRLEAKSIQGCFWVLRHEYLTAVLEPHELASYDEPELQA